MRQDELFPDAPTVRDRVVDALEDLKVGRALALVEEQRQLQPALAGMGELEGALRWLSEEIGGEAVDLELAARLHRGLPRAVASGAVTRRAAFVADAAIACFVLRRMEGGALFVGGDAVAIGSFRLARHAGGISKLEYERSACRAARELEAAVRVTGSADPSALARADLLGRLGDAELVLGRSERANELHVRALALDPFGFDGFRTAREELARLRSELVRAHGAAVGPQLLLVEAFLADLLDVPRGAEWTIDDLPRLEALATRLVGEERRARAFTLLFLRERASSSVDLGLRDRMADVDGGLLRRLVEHEARRAPS